MKLPSITRSWLRFFCIFWMVATLSAQAQNNNAPSGELADRQPLPLEDLRLFTLVLEHIRRSYVEPISDQALLENAIKGMLQELDPHSVYLDAKHFSAIQENTKGKFSGVGLEVGTDDGYVRIITPVDGSPAAIAGLKVGDLIIKLDDESIQGLSLSEVAKRIRGLKGTSVTFTIVRQGVDEPFDVTVIRDTIKSQSVRSRVIEDSYGYVRISQFQSNTGKDFTKAISDMRGNYPKLKGLVLDLRNNPGGILQASVEVVDAFIHEGVIVYTEGRLGNSNQSFNAAEGDVANGLPLVVLINDGSASAAEIVAGALQDHQRAIVMGTTSFGKGSVQTILPVGENKGIKLTTAFYYTPAGRSIQAQGIIPDIEIKRATITELDQVRQLKEADLSGHFSNRGSTEESHQRTLETDDSRRDMLRDNQLFEAINMLKGLAIFKQASQKLSAE
ncbi:MAG: carboxyl-terminal processing protease [Cellvibrionaceae bacterium]|jgi:carboxyl-terminal processing protease